MYAPPVLYLLLLLPFLLLDPFATPAAAADIVEKRAEGSWLFAAQNNGIERSPECANNITHSLVRRYKHIAPRTPKASVYATRWRYLTVDDEQCLQSSGFETATIFLPSPPTGTVSDTATAASYSAFFLLGEDNSPRRCGTWIQKMPARYYFTDDLPKWREFIQDLRFLSPRQNDSDIVNAVKGDVFMMSQQFSPNSNGAVHSRTVCFYKKFKPAAPSPSPKMTPVPDAPRKCFPSDAVVELQNGRTVTMRDLQIGDVVRVGADKYSPVFFFSHRDSEAHDVFVRITVSSSHTLRLSAGHYLRLSSGILRAAGEVRLGDVLLVVPEGTICTAASTCKGLHAARVTKVERAVEGFGLYAPHTLQGDVVVDGVLASSYTTAVAPWLAHTLLAPLRALWRCCALRVSLDARDVPERAVPATRAVELAVHAVRNLHLT